MKILVVDDHALVREGLRQVLQGLGPEVEVLEAPHCERAFELAELRPDLDLVLLDYHLPGMTGLEALDVFGERHPELPIVVLSGAATPLMMRQVLAKGAAGFLTKTGRSDELLSALSRVLEGEVLASPDLLMADGQIDPPLTPRQEDVLQLLLQGYETKDICDKLFIAEQTAKSHVSAIIKAFGVKTRLQVIVAAARYGYGKGARPA